MRKFTVGQLTTAVRRRADIPVADDHVTDAEIREWLSAFYAELYDILVSSGLAYFEKTQTYATTSSQSYALPADFYGTLTVVYSISDTRDEELREIHPREIHRVSKVASAYSTRYRTVGNQLVLYPPPLAGQTYRLKYIPAPADLTVAAQEVDGVSGWEDFVVTGAVIYALSKKDRDTSVNERRLRDLRKRITDAVQNREIASALSLVQSDSLTDDPIWNDPAEWRFY